MPEIGGEVRQQTLHVFAFAIPGYEPNHGEGVPEVMQAWLKSGLRRAMNASLFTQTLVDQFRGLAGDALILDRSEQRGCFVR